LEPDDL